MADATTPLGETDDGLISDGPITWEDARATNLANWSERVGIHLGGYGIEDFVANPAHLSQVVRTDLDALAPYLPGGVAGLDVCHLQCHIGTDTVSLARAGARVTGVDFSPEALSAAAELAARLGVDASWVETDVLDARAAVDRQLGAETAFDVVYTSIGAVTWLADLDRWAQQIHDLLRPGGTFYIRDGHPMMYGLDERVDSLEVRYRYFENGDSQQWTTPTSYAGEGRLNNPRTFEFPHSLSETVSALLGAGLELLAFDEGKTLPWLFADGMVEREDGDFEMPAHLRERVPLTFTLVARRRD